MSNQNKASDFAECMSSLYAAITAARGSPNVITANPTLLEFIENIAAPNGIRFTHKSKPAPPAPVTVSERMERFNLYEVFVNGEGNSWSYDSIPEIVARLSKIYWPFTVHVQGPNLTMLSLGSDRINILAAVTANFRGHNCAVVRTGSHMRIINTAGKYYNQAFASEDMAWKVCATINNGTFQPGPKPDEWQMPLGLHPDETPEQRKIYVFEATKAC